MLRLGVWPQAASGVDGLASRSVWRESLERALREHAPACAGGIRRAARRTNDRLAGSRQPIPWCPKAMHSSYVIRAAATKDEVGLRQLVSFQSRNGWGNPGLRGSAAACLGSVGVTAGRRLPSSMLVRVHASALLFGLRHESDHAEAGDGRRDDCLRVRWTGYVYPCRRHPRASESAPAAGTRRASSHNSPALRRRKFPLAGSRAARPAACRRPCRAAGRSGG
jgi:hypothetical protein